MYLLFILVKFQDTKCEAEAVNHMTNNIMIKRKRTKEQRMIYNILHKKLKNNTNPPKQGVNSGAPEELAVPVLLTTMPPISAMRIPAVTEK